MSKCPICSTELKFMNTPTFGGGKLKSGGEICIPCFKKAVKINPTIKISTYELNELTTLLNSEDSKQSTIKDKIAALKIDNISSILGRKEINELPKILSESEDVEYIIQGMYNNGSGILVATSQRLIFIDKGLLYGLKTEDFGLDKITSIQFESGLLLGSVKIIASGNTAIINNVDKNSAKKFSDHVRNKLSAPKPTTSASSNTNVLEQLEKLGQLKASGILTEEEFAEQKQKLLAKL